MRLHTSLEIEAPPAVVFEVISTPERLTQWNASVASARRVGEGAVGLGSHAVMHGRVLGTTMESETEVVQFEPPHLFATRAVRGPRVHTTFRLEESSHGTWVDVTVEGDVPGGAFGSAIAENILRGDFTRSMHQLKTLCETEASEAEVHPPAQ